MSEFEELKNQINKVWIDIYGGFEVHEVEQLKLRVFQLGVDRNNWLDNCKAAQKEYVRLEKKLREK